MFPALRRAMFVAGGTTAILGLAERASHAQTSDQALGALWGTALDGMVGVPGTSAVLYLAPSTADGPPTPKTMARLGRRQRASNEGQRAAKEGT